MLRTEIDSLAPSRDFSRRDFVQATVGTGFAAAVLPVTAQTITTDTAGLTAGAVTIDVAAHDHGSPAKMPWTYAYFELAQRDTVIDPSTGKKVRFEGFLGPQATNLFEMTRIK